MNIPVSNFFIVFVSHNNDFSISETFSPNIDNGTNNCYQLQNFVTLYGITCTPASTNKDAADLCRQCPVYNVGFRGLKWEAIKPGIFPNEFWSFSKFPR